MKKWISLLLAALLLLSLAACGESANSNTAKSNATEQLSKATATPIVTPEPTPALAERAGLYKVTELSSEEDGDYTDYLPYMESLGWVITLELFEDGTGIYTIGDEAEDAVWDLNTITINGDTQTYTYKQGTITVDAETGEHMVFKSITAAELEAILHPAAEENAELAGLYLATACTQDGADAGVDDEYLYLFADGTGFFNLLGAQYGLSWTLTGDSFLFRDVDGDVFTGTYRDGVIQGSYYSDYSYVFEASTPSALYNGETVQLAAFPGSYRLVNLVTDLEGDLGEKLDALEDLEMDMSIILEKDGTGVITMFGMSEYDDPLTWDEENLYLDGDTVPYLFNGYYLITVEDDGLTLFTLAVE